MAITAQKPKPKKTQVKKKSVGGKKKKQVLKFHIECKNPAEDGILKTQNFVSLNLCPKIFFLRRYFYAAFN